MFEAIIAWLFFSSVEAERTIPEPPFVALEAPIIWEIPKTEEPAISEATTSENIVLSTPHSPLEGPTRASTTPESVYASCVRFLREVRGIPLPIIAYARNLVPNITFSQVRTGDVIIFNYLPWGHIAEVLEVRNDGVWVIQSNKVKGKVTQELIPYSHFPRYVIGFWRAEKATLTSRNGL